VTFIKIRSHRRKFSNSDSVEQKNTLSQRIHRFLFKSILSSSAGNQPSSTNISFGDYFIANPRVRSRRVVNPPKSRSHRKVILGDYILGRSYQGRRVFAFATRSRTYTVTGGSPSHASRGLGRNIE
jgi:hypothetical protein